MKKPKLNINFGEGGFQGWLVRHCEKMILGVVVFLALFVIWGGYSLTGLESGKSPDKLRAAAQAKQEDIRETSWETFKPERDPPNAGPAMVDAGPIVPDQYPFRGKLNPPDFRMLTPRTDPTIYPPINLKPVPIVGALAYHSSAGYKDGLPMDAGADDPKRPVGRPQPRAGGMPAFPGMPAAGGRPPRGKTKGGPMGLGGPMGAGAPGGLEEMPGGVPGEEMMPGMDMPGMGFPGMGGAASSEQVVGFRPPADSIAKTKYAVVLMALVQHQKQWEEFERALANSLDPDPLRDQPAYLTFFVQRVDVTDDPNVDPATIPDAEWERERVRTGDALKDAAKWAGFPQDVLDPNYLMQVNPDADPTQWIGLTHPLPPFVQRDLWDAMTHPDIPLASAASQMQYQQDVPAEEAGDETGDDIPGVPGVPGGGRRPGGFMPGAMMPGGMMPGGGMAGGAVPGGEPDSGAGPYGSGSPYGRPGMPGGGMMGGGMMGGAMMGRGMMGGGMMGGMGYASPLVKYKLIRITDLSVQPGRKYRYRVKVVLDDPNNPRLSVAPRHAALDETVRDRLKTEEAKNKFVTSKEWSAPSEVVSMPSPQWFYAGKVESDSGQMLVANTRPVRREPEATAVAVVHDPAKGADIPTKQTVYRGTTLNLKTDVEVVHPVRGEFRTLKDYVLRTDAVVADMLGGETIPLVNKDRSDKMTVPGELLIVDADGNLLVQDESEDIEDFRRFAADEEKSTSAAQPDAEMMPGAMPMGLEGIPGGEDIPGGGGVPAPRGPRGRRGM